MRNTPRTDAMLEMDHANSGVLVLHRAINLCRELELDLAECKERIAAGMAAHNEDRARADSLARELEACRAVTRPPK